MKNFTTLLLLLVLCHQASAQTTTVNLGMTTNLYDSTFVIQTGTVDSFYQGIHPGAGPYMNGEIYLCANSVLKYNYPPGTSSYPTFYLEDNAQLIFTQSMMSGQIYMKNGASVTGNNQMNFINIKRVAGSSVSNFGAGSTIQDSVFTTVNYTFTGWPNNSSPCQAPTAVNQTTVAANSLVLYPNPSKDRLFFSNIADELFDIRVMTTDAKTVLQGKIMPREGIALDNLPTGLYFIVARNANGNQLSGRFFRE